MKSIDKVKMHMLYTEFKLGYVEIARMFEVRNVEVVSVVEEVEEAKKAFANREKVVYRKHYVNPRRKNKDIKTIIVRR